MARGAVSDLRVRCAVVVSDPALSASQPVPALAASAANALGHAAEAPCTLRANPVSTLAAHEAARAIVAAFARRDREPDRPRSALGALLAGYAIDSAGLGLHHVLAQTLVRAAGAAHGQANAVLLPHTLAALAWRFPVQAAALEETLGEDPSAAAARLAALAHAQRLRELGIAADALPRCADVAAERAELDATPPRADRAEVLRDLRERLLGRGNGGWAPSPATGAAAACPSCGALRGPRGPGVRPRARSARRSARRAGPRRPRRRPPGRATRAPRAWRYTTAGPGG